MPLLKGTQSKLNQNQESLGNALSLYDRSFQQSHFTVVIFTVLKSFICMFCVEIQIKVSPLSGISSPSYRSQPSTPSWGLPSTSKGCVNACGKIIITSLLDTRCSRCPSQVFKYTLRLGMESKFSKNGLMGPWAFIDDT